MREGKSPFQLAAEYLTETLTEENAMEECLKTIAELIEEDHRDFHSHILTLKVGFPLSHALQTLTDGSDKLKLAASATLAETIHAVFEAGYRQAQREILKGN